MSTSYEKQMQEKEEMFKEEAQEALREHPDRAVGGNSKGEQAGSERSDNESGTPAPVGPPKVIQVVTPHSPTMLIVSIEQCLEAFAHLNQGVEEADMAREDALEYIFNRHCGRMK